MAGASSLTIDRALRMPVATARSGRNATAAVTDGSARPTQRQGGDRAGVGHEWLHDRFDRSDLSRSLSGIGPAMDARRARVVEQQFSHLDPAHSVGERVVDLLDERGLSARQTFDQRELPQRPVLVERGHRQQPGHVQHGPQVARRWAHHTAEVVADIEVVVVLPTRRPDAHGRRHHLAAIAALDSTLRPLGGTTASSSDCGRATRWP